MRSAVDDQDQPAKGVRRKGRVTKGSAKVATKGKKGGKGKGDIDWEAREEDNPDALREARSRIEEILQETKVTFNGAAEPGLPSMATAWSIEHTDESVAAQNVEIVSNLAEVLCEYPRLTFEVHGETGLVQSAPEPLAEYLRDVYRGAYGGLTGLSPSLLWASTTNEQRTRPSWLAVAASRAEESTVLKPS